MNNVSFNGTSNIQQAAVLVCPQQESSIDKMTARLKAIANHPDTLETLKDAGISMIPVYGTYREFEKGNIGWGIFGAVTDAACLAGVGFVAKGAACSIRGGAAAAKIARAGLAGSRAAKGASALAHVGKDGYLLNNGAELIAKLSKIDPKAAELAARFY